MKKLLPILLLAGFSSPAIADITHKLSSSSVQLKCGNAAATQVERIGSTYLYQVLVLTQHTHQQVVVQYQMVLVH